VDEETEALVAAVRPLIKTHIRQTRNLLAYLSELEKRLEAHSQKEAESDAKETIRAA
jgi:hypothetical protein